MPRYVGVYRVSESRTKPYIVAIGHKKYARFNTNADAEAFLVERLAELGQAPRLKTGVAATDADFEADT